VRQQFGVATHVTPTSVSKRKFLTCIDVPDAPWLGIELSDVGPTSTGKICGRDSNFWEWIMFVKLPARPAGIWTMALVDPSRLGSSFPLSFFTLWNQISTRSVQNRNDPPLRVVACNVSVD
jgi:hypothetical protein